MIGCTARLALTAPAALLLASLGTSAQRVAMTASDVPTTTGAPDNGFEGLRFLGYRSMKGWCCGI
jgi:peptide/nickel transport system substrate-binding protein